MRKKDTNIITIYEHEGKNFFKTGVQNIRNTSNIILLNDK